MPAYQHLRTELDDDGVAVVTLDRAPVNAVDLLMYRELHALFSDVDQLGPDVRAVVLTGAGRHFCAGNDLDDFATMTPDNARVRMYHVREAFFAVERCAVPVVGAVRGAALGTGLALMASCDFAVVAHDARIGLPELGVGVMGGARHLGRLAHQPTVRWAFFTGETLSGDDAVRLGAAVHAVPDEDVVTVARAAARRIAGFSPTAVRLGKSGLDAIEGMDLHRGYEHEQGLTVRMTAHGDCKVALHAARAGEPAVYGPADPTV